MATIITDAQVNAHKARPHQKEVQAARFMPIVVDLSTDITLGRAILEACNAEVNLAIAVLQRTVTVPLTAKQEIEVLDLIHFIAIENAAAAVSILAYESAGTHLSTAPISTDTYKAVGQLYRSWVSSSGSAITLGVGLD